MQNIVQLTFFSQFSIQLLELLLYCRRRMALNANIRDKTNERLRYWSFVNCEIQNDGRLRVLAPLLLNLSIDLNFFVIFLGVLWNRFNIEVNMIALMYCNVVIILLHFIFSFGVDFVFYTYHQPVNNNMEVVSLLYLFI